MSIFLGRTPVIGEHVDEAESWAVLIFHRVLGTAQAAWDLLEKRSDIYSSRPRFIVA